MVGVAYSDPARLPETLNRVRGSSTTVSAADF